MSTTKVAPQTVKFVEMNTCEGQCSYTMTINNGLPLPCMEWTTEESMMLRERMLRDNELIASGFVRRMERSDLGNSNRYRASGIDIGEVRTQDSGASNLDECAITFNPITFSDFEKEFYVVKAELNTRMCTKQFIGKRQQELISNRYSTYNIAEEFANTDLAMIIVAKVIEKFQDFLPEFMILASKGGSGRNLHGDDGILAKAFYAEQGIYFHTIQYDLSDVEDNFPDTYLNAIVGGAKWEKDPSAFTTADEYILDFVAWLNGLKERREFMFDATYNSADNKLVVASNFITRQIDLRIVLNDGSMVDWGCEKKDLLVFDELQQRCLINDRPISWQYEKIDNTNFFEKFKNYKKEFMIYLHNNGFRDISIDNVLIGIDPLLMLEREDYLATQRLAGNFNAGSIDEVGFQFGQFKPLNLLTNTGLFFMTIPNNILQLSDGTGFVENVRIKESNCDKSTGKVDILGGVPPVGSDVEAWGVFGSNITDSWFVIDNGLANRQPYKHTMKVLQCYDDNVKNGCATPSKCNVSHSVSTEIVYDNVANTTSITVMVDALLNVPGTLTYNIDWALSDGTAGTGETSPTFVITLPGDQTDNGYRLSVTGDITGTPTGGGDTCKEYITYTEQIGEGGGFGYCTHTITADFSPGGVDVGGSLQLQFNVNGVPAAAEFDNVFLTLYNNLGGNPYLVEIPNEIEAILPGTVVTMEGTPPNDAVTTSTTITIENVPSFITNIILFSNDTNNSTDPLTQDC